MLLLTMILGAAMVVGGVAMIVRFYRGRGANDPEVASPTRVETLLVGALLASIGTLVLILGVTGVIGASLGAD